MCRQSSKPLPDLRPTMTGNRNRHYHRQKEPAYLHYLRAACSALFNDRRSNPVTLAAATLSERPGSPAVLVGQHRHDQAYWRDCR